MRANRLLPALVLVALVALALGGCGKKGALIPPEALAPAAVSDLALAQKGPYFQLSWSLPTKQQGGARLGDLAGFDLLRRIVLPAQLDCEECPSAYTELARIDLDYPRQARRIGNLLIYDDHDLKPGENYQYKVRSFTSDGVQSRDSNKARHAAAIPPLPPVLEALSSGSGVVLAFVAPPPEEGKLVGYRIYRSKSGEPMPLAPLTPQPVAGTTFEDTQILVGERYSYLVRTVAAYPNGETAESAPSNQVEGTVPERD